MRFYISTKRSARVGLQEAVMKGMPGGGGLYQPLTLPRLGKNDFRRLMGLPFPDMAVELSRLLLEEDIPADQLERICHESFTFPLPLVSLGERRWILELFHGPTWAFKDFGARFLARVMAWYQRSAERPLTVLVATSGDTGGAVANGFFRVPGVRVVILYPRGRISSVQEHQIATLGENITALEVEGSFDDCQYLVKAALSDNGLRERRSLTTANSINIGRLLPQMFYYIFARLSLDDWDSRVAFVVPSGNFGNLTAAAMARKMGLPIDHLLAATTINDTVHRYLTNGIWQPQPVRQTLATAMDIAEPSNFHRLLDFYNGDFRVMSQDISARVVRDDDIRETVIRCHERCDYILDPHSAAGVYSLEGFMDQKDSSWKGVSLATADPSKFPELTADIIGGKVNSVPGRQLSLKGSKQSLPQQVDMKQFIDLLWDLDR